MTEESSPAKASPAPAAPNPQAKINPNALLKPKKKSGASYMLPAALAAGGAALLISKMKKKGKKRSSPKAPPAGASEVTFASNYGSYSIGKDYKQLVLEPYLSEQAEYGNLSVRSVDMSNTIFGTEDALIESTRKEILEAFRSTHMVKVGSEEVLIKSLPKDKTGVKKFNEWLTAQIKDFQENY